MASGCANLGLVIVQLFVFTVHLFLYGASVGICVVHFLSRNKGPLFWGALSCMVGQNTEQQSVV